MLYIPSFLYEKQLTNAINHNIVVLNRNTNERIRLMENVTMIDKLLLFGLSRQESVIYMCLLKNSELTGYEVAKLTGISRSNVYNGLAALVEHGAAYVKEGASTKYVAVSLNEFCDNYIRYLQGVQVYLMLNEPKRIENTDGYITIEGKRHISDKIHNMLKSTQKRIYFSANANLLEQWKKEIQELISKEIKVVLISDRLPECFREAYTEGKAIFYESLPEEDTENSFCDRQKQVRLIIDSEYVLTGEITGSDSDTCLYSAQKNFVTVIKDAMRNEMELIKIKGKKED